MGRSGQVISRQAKPTFKLELAQCLQAWRRNPRARRSQPIERARKPPAIAPRRTAKYLVPAGIRLWERNPGAEPRAAPATTPTTVKLTTTDEALFKKMPRVLLDDALVQILSNFLHRMRPAPGLDQAPHQLGLHQSSACLLNQDELSVVFLYRESGEKHT